ncbi:unnamed protein product [Microthlaspi erraticum]|uniref:F-box domain-containing protein n=1 Tax=Microthlaspi erraticum TaxID=1685480 RepID=A0A6D2KMA2_9BRAS|nr:unnamed protein product [Microthlaspi erraticum]
MRTISDLPGDLVEEEIFSRAPITSLRSVRSTCKKWNFLSKNRVFFGKEAAAAARKQFMGFMMKDSRVCLMKLDLQGIGNKGELVYPCIKQVSVLDQIKIFSVFQSSGLLLCVLKDMSRLLVWNPYLGQTRWVEPRDKFESGDKYALGYGYDDKKNRNHKILMIFYEYDPNRSRHVSKSELYDFSLDSWKVFDATPEWDIWGHQRGVTLKGNAYFPAQKMIEKKRVGGFMLCFDFTRESFGPLLPLPFHAVGGEVFASLSCVREEKLAVLYRGWEKNEPVEIFVTDKIGPDVVSWTKFLTLLPGFFVNHSAGSFFIDEEKKFAVVLVLQNTKACRYHIAHIIGQDGYLELVNLGEAPCLGPISGWEPGIYYTPLVCSSYVPCLDVLESITK